MDDIPLVKEDAAEISETSKSRFQHFAEHMGHIRHYLSTGKYSPGLKGTTMRAIRKATSNGQYVIQGTLIQYTSNRQMLHEPST